MQYCMTIGRFLQMLIYADHMTGGIVNLREAEFEKGVWKLQKQMFGSSAQVTTCILVMTSIQVITCAKLCLELTPVI